MTFIGKFIPYQALLSRLYAHLGVKNLMITLAHPLIVPLHQTLGLHHWRGLPFRHFAKDSLPFDLWKNNYIVMQESGEYVLSITKSDHSIEYQASYKEDGEDGGQQKDDDHPI